MKGELKKLKITAYRTIKFETRDKVDEFTALFNPASYQQKYEVEYADGQGQGTSASSQRFGKIKPQDYTFELLFDGTGAAAEKREVADDVDRFLTLTGRLDGDIHRPLFLVLSWGPLELRCVLKSAEATYNLFRPDGYPLRAKVQAVFSEAIEDTLRVSKEGRSSPDVTHARVVVEGDTLPLVAHRMYGSPAYAAAVAYVNGLDHLRDLRAGRTLRLPPLAPPGGK